MSGSHWKWQAYKTIIITTKPDESPGLPRATGSNQTRILKNLIISLIQLLTEYIGKGFFMHTPFCGCVCGCVRVCVC